VYVAEITTHVAWVIEMPLTSLRTSVFDVR